MSKINSCIDHLILSISLDRPVVEDIFQVILNGGAVNSQIGALLTAFMMKGETDEELLGYLNTILAKSPVRFDLDIKIESLDKYDRNNLSQILLTSSLISSQAGLTNIKYIDKSLVKMTKMQKFIASMGINYKKISNDVLKTSYEETNFGFIDTDYVKKIYNITTIIEELELKSNFCLVPSLCLPNLPNNMILFAANKNEALNFSRMLQPFSELKSWIIYNEFNSYELLREERNFVVETYHQNINFFEIDLRRYKFKPLAEIDELYQSDSAREVIFGKKNQFYNSVVLYTAIQLMITKTINLEQSIYEAESLIQSGGPLNLLSKLINFTNFV